MLMVLNLNPQVRSAPTVAASTLTRVGSATLTTATAVLNVQVPRLCAVHGQRHPVHQRGRARLRRADAAVAEALQPQLQHAGVVYLRQVARQHDGQRRRRQRLPGARRSAPGSQRRTDRVRRAAQLHRQRNRPRAADPRVERQLGRARPERLAVQADQRQHRPRSQRHSAEPLPAGEYTGNGPDPYTVKDYKSQRNGARGPGFFSLDMRFGYRFDLPNRRRIELSPTSSTCRTT